MLSLDLRLFGFALAVSLERSEEPEADEEKKEIPYSLSTTTTERQDGSAFGFTTNDPAFPPLTWEEDEE